MRVRAFPIIVSLVLFAAPAFAQSSTMMGVTTDQSGVSSSSNTWHHGMGVSSNTKEKIRQSLTQSGFKDIRVTPEAFVIRAEAPDGSHVVMLLRPDEMSGVIESGSSSEPNTSTNNGSSATDSGANH